MVSLTRDKAHRDAGENILTATNAQHRELIYLSHHIISSEVFSRTARADHEVYCPQLVTKKRGYPLWAPGPGRRLPIEYRRKSISIGDVGIISSLGAFKFLFIIFQPSNHPINRGGVLRGFFLKKSCSIFKKIWYTSQVCSYLASSSVRRCELDQESIISR